MIHFLTHEDSILHPILSELTHADADLDRMRSRRNMERIGEIFAYELSKQLDYEAAGDGRVLVDQPVLAPILRAGLPVHHGFLRLLDRADSAFVGARKVILQGGAVETRIDYISAPDLDGSVLVLIDLMLATGASMQAALEALLTRGTPRRIHVVAAFASREGLDAVQRAFPDGTTYWIGALRDLRPAGVVPAGAGDAGDLAFGVKRDR